MMKTPAIAARILAGALALAAHCVSAQAPDMPGAPSAEPPAAPPPAPPPATRAPGAAAVAIVPRAGEVVLNFQGADLQAVVKAMSQMTGRNMLIDPRVRGQVTIVSARPMSVAAGYQIFLSALKTQGFTAVEGPGDTVRIIPVAEAKAAAPVSEQEGPPRGGEQVITHVVIGQHVAVAQLQNVLRPLMSPTSQLSVYDPANALIITDYADNVRRLLRIIERIDQPASTDVTVIPVQHASAIDLAELVVRLSGTGIAAPGVVPGVPPTQIAAGGDRFSVVPDGRTNSILLRSDNPGRIALLRSLIERLDVPARAIGSTRVIYLKHAEATKLVEVLRGMLSAAATAAPGQTGAPGARPGGAAPSLIQADEATNSIIINASDTVYNNLRLVIEQLDVRRAQVYVEALIAEMNADRTDELGFQWAAVGGVGSRGVGATANFRGGDDRRRRGAGRESLSDDRAQGRGSHSAHQAADLRGLDHPARDLSGGLEPRPDCARPLERPHHDQALARNQGRGGRWQYHRARRADPEHLERDHAADSAARRHSDSRRAVPLQERGAQAHQPDDLPAAG